MAVGQTISEDEFKKRYQSPISQQAPQNKSFLQKTGDVLGGIFGGKQIGEYIGSKIAERGSAAQSLKNDPMVQEQMRKTGQPMFQQPTGKQIAGDVLKIGTTLASAAIPGAGSIAGRVAQGVGMGYASDVAEGLIAGRENPLTPGFGTAVGGGFPLATKLVGSLLKRGVALTTGAGREVIDRAIHNPDAVGDAIKQYAKTDASRQGLVSRAKTAIYDFLGERSDEFAAEVSKTKFSKPFTKQEIVGSFSEQLKKFNGKITSDGLKFESTALTAADQNNLNAFYTQLRGWKDFTPGGIERFRQAISNNISDFKAVGSTRADVVLGGLKKFVTNGLEQRASGYKDILGTYGRKTQLASDVLKELNLSGNAKSSTQLNSIMRIFKKDSSVVEGLVKIMGKEEADGLLNDLSGAILSEWLPIGARRQVIEGLGTLGGIYGIATGGVPVLPAVAAAASASPRIVGQAAVNTGRALNAGVGTGIRRGATIGASELNQ